jgi:hypothetical protein
MNEEKQKKEKIIEIKRNEDYISLLKQIKSGEIEDDIIFIETERVPEEISRETPETFEEEIECMIRTQLKAAAERIKNGGIRSFYKWLAESPFTVNNLSVERGLHFSGIIETNKDKEYEKIMFLRVANNIPLEVGDIMNWQIEDGSVEKWILAQKVKKVNGTY